MNLIKERKKCGAVCPVCHHPDYVMEPIIPGETTKPTFTCRRCNHFWSYGYDGGQYARLAGEV